MGLKNSLSLFFLMLGLGAAGCASSSVDTLELNNILEWNAEMEARKQAKAEEEQRALEQAVQSVTIEKSLKEIFEQSVTDPPELDFLEFPEDFERSMAAEEHVPDFVKAAAKQLPGSSTAWYGRGLDLMIFSGKQPLDKDFFLRLTKDRFEAELMRVSEEFDRYYRRTYQAQVSHQRKQIGAVSLLKVESRYLKDNDWHADLRYFYFYKPAYRLNILITGKEEDLNRVASQINISMQVFEKRLSEYFPEGIKFWKSE